MSINNGDLISGHTIVTYPVSVYDVSRTTRKGSLDVGTLCGDTNVLINKWAKYKPVSVNGLINTVPQLKGGTGSDKNEWSSSATWWKRDGNCGLELLLAPRCWNSSTADTSKTESMRQAEAASLDEWFNNSWKYAFRPAGGITSPFRLIDFNYYDHNAVPFIKSVTVPPEDSYFAGDDREDIKWILNTPTNGEDLYSLKVEDLDPSLGSSNKRLDEYYLGIILVHEGSEFPDYSNLLYRKYVAINTYKINATNNRGLSITISGSLTSMLINDENILSQQYYRAYPILAAESVWNNSIFLFGSTSFGPILAVPNAEPFDISIIPNDLEGFIEGSVDAFMTFDNIRQYYVLSLSLHNRSKVRDMTISSLTSIALKMQVWIQSGNTWVVDHEISTSGTIEMQNVTFPVTILHGANTILNFIYKAPESEFPSGCKVRLVGTISYAWSKTGDSGTSTATLLSWPTTAYNVIIEPQNFAMHVVSKNITSEGYQIDVWAENISGSTQTFSWNNIRYDQVSFSKNSQGETNYNDTATTTHTVATGSESVAAGANSTVKTVTVTPGRSSNSGYLSIVTVYGINNVNVGTASASGEYTV